MKHPISACIIITGVMLSFLSVSNAAERPNILLIVADDMGFSDIHPFGSEIPTPALDALAAEGITLTNFHVLPSCSPTRSVLLSGMDNHLAGIGTMAEFMPPEAAGNPGYAGYLNFEVAALPEVMKANGYHTYMVGKWHLGEDPKTIPHARGFEETFILLQGGGSHWADQKPLSPPLKMDYRRNGKPVDALPEDFYSTKSYTDMLLDWIDRDAKDDKPFFAYVAFTATHDPLHAPAEFIAKHKGKYDGGWDALREERLRRLKDLGIVAEDAAGFPRLPSVEAWEALSDVERAEAARDMEVYAAMVDYMDTQIQRIIDRLKENGQLDNTVIMFFSDNGANGAPRTAYPGTTEEFLAAFDNSIENRGLPNSYIDMGPGWAQATMAPSRMFKAFPAEGGIRSPMIVKLPGKMKNAGSMNSAFLHVRDLMPTILDLADIEHPGAQFEGRVVRPMQGQSVRAVLAGDAKVPPPGVSSVGYELFGMKAYFQDRWKILLMPKPYGTGDWELFDLERDPGELQDLSSQHPEKRAELIALWKQYQTENGVLDVSLDPTKKMK